MTARDLAERTNAPARTSRSALAARYRSLFVLGRGGMGSVEAALEIEPSSRSEGDEARPYQRVVALKRLLPDAARDRRRVDMFLREARLAAMLDHPNVVRAYDYGEIDGELYLSMEYVEGQPLSRVLRAVADAHGRLAPEAAAYVLAEVCRGLHAAHELTDPATGLPLRLVHRDVSPQNVMIGYDGRVRLLDFGVAKIETENVTKTGEVKGKTAYMSPEQAMGEPLDRRSDLFGVGAILFECLALRRMWGDGTDMDVIRKLALESPPPLDTCGVELDDGLAALHARLVARDASARPATALEVATALDAVVEDPDVARATLCSLLDRFFSEQANDQRARLTSSLHEVAPDQAESLRESVLPGAVTPSKPPHPKAPAATSSVTTTPTHAKTIVLGASSLAVASAFVWWFTAGTAPSTTPPSGATSSTVLHTTTATATARPTATAPPTPIASPTPKPIPLRRPATPLLVTPPTASQPRSTPPPKPPDIDEKPF